MIQVPVLWVFAARQLVRGACAALGLAVEVQSVDAVCEFLQERFSDHSLRLRAALKASTERAWKALEVALAGETFWNWLDRAEDRALRAQVRAFLDAVPAAQIPAAGDDFRRLCLLDLRAARKAGRLAQDAADLHHLARCTADFARFAHPQNLIQAEWQLVQDFGASLAQAGHVHLSRLLMLRPAADQPILALAARYFFRRAIEDDSALFQGLIWASWEQLADSQRLGFGQLHEALERQGGIVEARLEGLHSFLEKIHTVVEDIRSEQLRQGRCFQDLYDVVLDIQRRLNQGDMAAARRGFDTLEILFTDARALAQAPEKMADADAPPAGNDANYPAQIALTFTEGRLSRRHYVFEERTTCIIGRDRECDPQVPDDKDHRCVSRLHCLLDINPPDLRIRDFGSLFGTFVNGVKIGQRVQEEDRGKAISPEHDLCDGDVVRLTDEPSGQGVTFRVGIRAPSRPRLSVCARCGKTVAAEPNQRRKGAIVCATCRADPAAIVDQMLELARTGERAIQVVHGYRNIRCLGEGNSGAVYLVRHHDTGEELALKILLPRVAADDRAVARFLREAELTRALRHRHIVGLRGLGCWQGTFFFTLDYCEGGSVQRLLRQRGGCLPLDEAIQITLQTLAGLEYAHAAEVSIHLPDGSVETARGVVHRDLCPNNVFLTGLDRSYVVKIGDFGLAHAFDLAGLSGQTRTGSTAGKPHFMPRQQIVNFKYVRPEVDIWAAAACFYFMVTGEYPRTFPDGQDPWQIVLTSKCVPIRDRCRGKQLPDRMAQVIDYVLDDNPDIRCRTVAEFRRIFEQAC